MWKTTPLHRVRMARRPLFSSGTIRLSLRLAHGGDKTVNVHDFAMLQVPRRSDVPTQEEEEEEEEEEEASWGREHAEALETL